MVSEQARVPSSETIEKKETTADLENGSNDKLGIDPASIQQLITQELEPYLQILKHSTNRIIGLVHFYIILQTKPEKEETGDIDDLLRSGIVFTHAALEEFLRAVGVSLLPWADEQTLNSIPLVGISNSGRPEKFLLGKLKPFAGQTIESVIETSIQSHFERKSFSSLADIKTLFTSVGLDSDVGEKHHKVISDLMKRRHRIVHRSDIISYTNETESKTYSINASEVLGYIEAVIALSQDILTNVVQKQLQWKGLVP